MMDSTSRVSGVGCRVLGVGCRVSGVGIRSYVLRNLRARRVSQAAAIYLCSDRRYGQIVAAKWNKYCNENNG